MMSTKSKKIKPVTIPAYKKKNMSTKKAMRVLIDAFLTQEPEIGNKLTVEEVNKLWHIHTMRYYTAVKKTELL